MDFLYKLDCHKSKRLVVISWVTTERISNIYAEKEMRRESK